MSETIQRAYSILEVKAADDDKRILEGIATTPEPDSYQDIVEPLGAQFALPLPFLWQHNHDQPIGHVVDAKASSKGIRVKVQIAKIAEPGPLKERVDLAWQSFKSGLVRGLSIGFRSIEHTFIEGTGGVHFMKWKWLELSGVTIPANESASITAIKSIDSQLRAVSGKSEPRFVRLIQQQQSPVGVVKAARPRSPIQLIQRS
jgi:HK97 family phage prohead protease